MGAHDQNEVTDSIVLPCLPPADSSTDRWYEYLRNTVVSSYHYFGTAAAGSVVDASDFRVKGTENLHVVDGSILPKVTHVNPQGTIMALGHYAGKRLAAAQGSQDGGRRLDSAAAAADRTMAVSAAPAAAVLASS